MSASAFTFDFDQYGLADTVQDTQQSKTRLYPFDFYQPTQDILVPTADSFDFDLDVSLAAEDTSALQLLPIDPNPALYFVRPETARPGPPSTFSESAYESLSSQSESLYRSSTYSQSSYAQSDFAFDLDSLKLTQSSSLSDYGSSYAGSAFGVAAATVDLDAVVGFGLSPSPPYSPDSPKTRQESFADYEAPFTPSPVAPTSMSVSSNASMSPEVEDNASTDPRKKYKCNACPRAFARAFNLKTHMATHDPNRLKPHVCPHSNCGRSFSRKHDLGRHLISIHREDQGKSAVGVQKGNRVWCDQCGKSAQDKLDCECDKV